MEGLSGDLQIKYQKIASEYAKLRAQASVLKKAVVDEQRQNAELRDDLRERDQNLRKSTQEMDSLTFRNQQLTKRVTVLLEELEVSEARPKRGKAKAADGSHQSFESGNVIDEELQKKIAENVRLVTLLQDSETSHQHELSSLHERVELLEHELRKHSQANDDTEAKFSAVIARLENENLSLGRGASERDDAISRCSAELCSLRLERSELGRQLEAAAAVVASRLPFVDTLHPPLNELNVPRHERKRQLYSLHVIAQAGNHVRDLAAALSDYHTYTEQRVRCVHDVLSPVNAKFSAYLRENARYLRGIEIGYSELLSGLESGDRLLTLQTLPGLQGLSSKLTTYTNYLLKLLPYQQLSLEEEAAVSNDVRLVTSNKEVQSQVKCITNHFVKLNSYVKLLSVQSKRSCQHPALSQRRFFLELTDVLKALTEAMKGLSRAHSARNSLQNEISTATERLKTTDDCLVKSIETMIAATVKLASVLSDSRAELWKSTGWPTVPTVLHGSNTHPAVAALQQRASRYLCSLDADEPPAVAYRDALRDRETVEGSVANCERLERQLDDCKGKAAKLEQDKERWHLEYQLLQLRHSKRTKELEDRLQVFESTETQSAEDKKGCQEMSIEPRAVTNLLGSLEAPLVLTAEMEAREQEVKEYLTGRIDHLVAIKQEEETKATTFKMECIVLEKRLELCTANKLSLDGRLHEAQDRVVRLQEELHTTTHNYDTQLCMMSEHLANMNNKLAVQRDEIDQLKYQLTNKSSRKGKQK